MVKYSKPLVLCISSCHRAYCGTLRLGLLKAGWCTSRRVTMVAAAVATAHVMASSTLWMKSLHMLAKSVKRMLFNPVIAASAAGAGGPQKALLLNFGVEYEYTTFSWYHTIRPNYSYTSSANISWLLRLQHWRRPKPSVTYLLTMWWLTKYRHWTTHFPCAFPNHLRLR